jgi:hypothetical protein
MLMMIANKDRADPNSLVIVPLWIIDKVAKVDSLRLSASDERFFKVCGFKTVWIFQLSGDWNVIREPKRTGDHGDDKSKQSASAQCEAWNVHGQSLDPGPLRIVPYNAGLQLRRAISLQAEGIRLLEKHAIAQSAARLC